MQGGLCCGYLGYNALYDAHTCIHKQYEGNGDVYVSKCGWYKGIGDKYEGVYESICIGS